MGEPGRVAIRDIPHFATIAEYDHYWGWSDYGGSGQGKWQLLMVCHYCGNDHYFTTLPHCQILTNLPSFLIYFPPRGPS